MVGTHARYFVRAERLSWYILFASFDLVLSPSKCSAANAHSLSATDAWGPCDVCWCMGACALNARVARGGLRCGRMCLKREGGAGRAAAWAHVPEMRGRRGAGLGAGACA